MQSSLEQEIKERKAEYQSTNTSSGNKSKLSDALDKLFCKQKEKELQQQQRHQQKLGKQSKRLSHCLEVDKSPVDMEIEQKLSGVQDIETIDIVKESMNQCPIQSDSQNKNVDDILQQDQVNESEQDDQQRQPCTNKYEQEQFVNNMPKPPTPKSSLIFSPPPASLTIDKREASIFDFADNFTIPNDSSVSLLSFNSDNLFKEDSAKETMDLVANLRQNIKKGGKGDECCKMKPSQSTEPEILPDNSINTNDSINPIVANIDIKAKSMVQPTIVIDLDQENSGDERKLPSKTLSATNTETSEPSSTDSNLIPQSSAQVIEMNQNENMTSTNITLSPLQLQTEVEQIASKMPTVIPPHADILIESEINDKQSINAFQVPSYTQSNTINGNKDTFDHPLQMHVRIKIINFHV